LIVVFVSIIGLLGEKIEIVDLRAALNWRMLAGGRETAVAVKASVTLSGLDHLQNSS
jgi:hypothetical protein